jgi:tetratricopeptide (TPR) repeat protein
VDAGETARLYAAAAEALAREGRAPDALDAWLEAAQRTEDVAVRRAAARACLEGGRLDRAEPFLSVEVAGEEPALLWAVGERAAQADDESVAMRALGRYRTLVPDEAERASALLARWEEAAAADVAQGAADDSWLPAGGDEVDLAAMLAEAPAEAPVPVYEQVADSTSQEPALQKPVIEEPVGEEPAVEALVVEEPVAEAAIAPEPVVEHVIEMDSSLDDADPEIDEAATIAQLQAAADTPALRFQAAAQLGRWFVQKGQLERGVEWLERACDAPAPVREHGLAARYDLADALERAGQPDRALACWSDLEFDAGSYRDVPERLAKLTGTLGSTSKT